MSHGYHLPAVGAYDLRSVTGRDLHLLPRPFESGEDALKRCRSSHNNDDTTRCCSITPAISSAATTSSRGWSTFHPCGFTHGPHPKALKNAFKSAKPATDGICRDAGCTDALQVGDGGGGRRMARLCR